MRTTDISLAGYSDRHFPYWRWYPRLSIALNRLFYGMKLNLAKRYTSLKRTLHKERVRLESRLEELYSTLGHTGEGAMAFLEPPRRTMSAAGRARIAAAQRARWRKVKAQRPATAAKKLGKRKMSAAGRARIAAAQKERWAKSRAMAMPPV